MYISLHSYKQPDTLNRATNKHNAEILCCVFVLSVMRVYNFLLLQSRTRRVPTALQDYQVDAVAASPAPEVPPASAATSGPAAAAGTRAAGISSRGLTAQQLHAVALDDADMTYTDAAAAAAGAADGGYGSSRGVRGPVQTQNRARGGAGGGGTGGPARGQVGYGKPQQYSQQQQQCGAQYQQGMYARAGAPNGYTLPHTQQQGAPGPAHQQYQQAGGRWQQAAQQQQQNQQQQQKGLHPGALGPGSHAMVGQPGPPVELMSQLLQTGSAFGGPASNAAAAAAVSTAAPAAAVALPAGVDYGAAFEAFTKVLGRVDPVAFAQHFAAAMQQQQQRHA